MGEGRTMGKAERVECDWATRDNDAKHNQWEE